MAGLAGLALAVSCERPPRAGEADAVVIALSLPDGATIEAVSWTISSSSGAVLASGSADTGTSGTTASFAVGLPPGLGDVAAMTATTNAGLVCSGTSPPFDVRPGRATSVDVALVCASSGTDGGLGSVVVTAGLVQGDACPVIGSWLLSPLQGAAGSPIAAAVVVTDPDAGDRLTYAWTATAGSFSDPTLPSTQYLCGPAGTETLSVTISDEHEPIPCVMNVSFPAVICL